MDAKEELIRSFYTARSRRDGSAVRKMLAPDVTWHELGPEQDYSGVHRGRDRVTALLERLVDVTGGSFSLEPINAITTAEHVATNVRWHAERGGTHVDGNDLAVFRIADGKIAEAWFFPDGFDAEALTQVFAFESD
jgi:ketosteroid isomerase-like protein